MGYVFLVLFFGVSALIGLWAIACLVSALIKEGPINLLKSYFSAVTGKDP